MALVVWLLHLVPRQPQPASLACSKPVVGLAPQPLANTATKQVVQGTCLHHRSQTASPPDAAAGVGEDPGASRGSRPQGSQLAALASAQSEPLTRREELDQRFAELQQTYGQQPVPRPEHWGGYRLVAERIEFWIHRDNRLHDRILYRWENDAWTSILLNP